MLTDFKFLHDNGIFNNYSVVRDTIIEYRKNFIIFLCPLLGNNLGNNNGCLAKNNTLKIVLIESTSNKKMTEFIWCIHIISFVYKLNYKSGS